MAIYGQKKHWIDQASLLPLLLPDVFRPPSPTQNVCMGSLGMIVALVVLNQSLQRPDRNGGIGKQAAESGKMSESPASGTDAPAGEVKDEADVSSPSPSPRSSVTASVSVPSPSLDSDPNLHQPSSWFRQAIGIFC